MSMSASGSSFVRPSHSPSAGFTRYWPMTYGTPSAANTLGVVVTWVCAYKGFHVGHGAEGVARATTQAVVLASVLILVWDYFIGSVLP